MSAPIVWVLDRSGKVVLWMLGVTDEGKTILHVLDRARTVLGEIAKLQQAMFSLTQDDSELNAQVSQWQGAVERYSGNALNSSERLIKGSVTFEDLRPNLDRMSSDLQQAQKLAKQLYDAFLGTDASLLEINPLIIT